MAYGDINGLTITHIHKLMRDIILESKMQLPNGSSSSVLLEEYPQRCSQAIKDLGIAGSYHAIVIDEAQDLSHYPYFMDVLDPLLLGGIEKGMWRMFLDPKQNIFLSGNDDVLPLIEDTEHAEYLL